MKKSAKELFDAARLATVPTGAVTGDQKGLILPTPMVIANIAVKNGQLTLEADDSLGENPLSAAGFSDRDQVLIIRISKVYST